MDFEVGAELQAPKMDDVLGASPSNALVAQPSGFRLPKDRAKDRDHDESKDSKEKKKKKKKCSSLDWHILFLPLSILSFFCNFFFLSWELVEWSTPTIVCCSTYLQKCHPFPIELAQNPNSKMQGIRNELDWHARKERKEEGLDNFGFQIF